MKEEYSAVEERHKQSNVNHLPLNQLGALSDRTSNDTSIQLQSLKRIKTS